MERRDFVLGLGAVTVESLVTVIMMESVRWAQPVIQLCGSLPEFA